MKFKSILTACSFLLFVFYGAAQITQPRNITGSVKNEQGEALTGVTVQIKSSSAKAITNASGHFSISLSAADSVLIFTSVGFEPQEVAVKDRSRLDIIMKLRTTDLADIVVIGYGRVRKSDLTGAVGQVKMDELTKAPVASFSEALAGRIAGVQVSSSDGQPGQGMNIVIRGANSLTQDNSPLYVIDGFPVEAEEAILNPDDIASINILKDASATAIYGARGANGVIVVETKKGRPGAPAITYNGSYGLQHATRKMDLLNPYEFVRYHNELNPALTATRYFQNGKTLDSYKDVAGIDWQDKVTRTAPISIHNIALRGGNAQTRYSLSASLYNQDGVIINSGYDRKQGRISVDQTINEKITAGVAANYSYITTYGQPVAVGSNGSATSNLYYSVWGYRPITGNDVNLEDEFLDPEDFTASDLRINPVINSNNTYVKGIKKDLLVNAYINYAIIPGLTLRVTGSIKNQSTRDDRFYNSLSSRGSKLNPNNTRGVNGSVEYNDINLWLNENTLTYSKTFNKTHFLEAVGGFTVQSNKIERYGLAAMNVPNESLGMSGLDEGTPYANVALKSSSGLISGLGRVNYNYRSKYFATASFRSDGSSKFPGYNRWSYFPSGALAWKISAEPFMKNISFIDEAKLRTSYGVTGNNRVGDFSYLPSLAMDNVDGYSFNNATPSPVVIPSNLGNANLKWENTKQLDLGLDLSMFNKRVDFTVDVYRKTTVDLLLNADVAYTTGYSNVLMNIGSIRNEGLEFTLNTVNIRNKNFTWQSNFNIAFNRNKILALAENQDNRLTALAWEYAYAEVPLYIAQVNKPAALFYGYVFDGIYQLSDFNEAAPGVYSLKSNVPNNGNARDLIKPGDIKYRDINGDGVVNAYDQTTLGNPQPLHTGGFINNFTYKGFNLSVLLQWSYGNDIYNANRIIFEGERPRANLNQYATVMDRWTPENPSNEIPRAGGNAPVGTYSSRVIEDGSFLRLKTVSLGYQIPSSIIKRLSIKSLVVDVSAQNIYTWTKYSGMDPEVSIRGTVLTPGFDYAPYPRSLTLVFGLKAAF